MAKNGNLCAKQNKIVSNIKLGTIVDTHMSYAVLATDAINPNVYSPIITIINQGHNLPQHPNLVVQRMKSFVVMG